MSNYLAIATVTAALQQVLQNPVAAAVSGANVGFYRPNATNTGNTGPLVNVYLFQVTPNAAYRNVDLPTRRSDGTPVRRPLTALDLHYLFTFHGSDEKLEPQRMLGAVASTLQAQPLLSVQNIQAAESHFTFLLGSGLENQLERIRFTPTALTLEEFSKLWSAFFQVEYSLSAVYQASVVLIEDDGTTPQEGLPVQSRNIYVSPFNQPTITQILSQMGPGQPILPPSAQPVLPSSLLIIQGTQLRSALTTVQIGNTIATPATVSESTITMPIPAGAQAGVLGVQVIQQVLVGTPPIAHPGAGYESNVLPLVLNPVIVPTFASSAQIELTVTPDVQPGQRVMLMLNQTGGTAPAAYMFNVVAPAVASGSLTIPIAGVQGGGTQYYVRLKVDGAESPLDLNTSSSTFGPTVTI
jgi:hypothetical protein